MSVMISNAVLEMTKQILADSLGIKESDISLHSYIKEDLGAESIDFLDIFQQAELKFGIRIDEGDLAPELRPPDDDEGWEVDINRELNEPELEKLRSRLPESVHERITPGLHVYEILGLINVETLAGFFQQKVSQKEAALAKS